ncbi:MAG: PD40 domain-containing protein, partial [Acidobacteriaceae bacterium]|nr:PD40 domain-containing protein [Acidobacteriaceae bacterium]
MRFPTVLLLAVALATGAEVYQKPPQEVLDVLNAPATPRAFVSPAHTDVLLADPLRYPPIADLGQPMLRLAGLRINPKNNGPHRAQVYTGIILKRVDNGQEVRLDVGPNAHMSAPRWSPDGKQFAFTNAKEKTIELWVGDASSGKIHLLEGVRVNAVMAPTTPFRQSNSVFQWLPDNRTLMVQLVRANAGPPPQEPAIPVGPHIQESLGKAGPTRTYEDMLTSEHDQDLFEYYATAQLALIDSASGHVETYGKPGIFESVRPSPDGRDVLVTRVHKPFSYVLPMEAFPKEVEIWDHAAKVVMKVASLPLEDRIPIDGVPTGPRDYEWRPTDTATLVWVEAMDGGNPKEKVPHRDRILMAKAPFRGEPVEVFKTEQRFQGMQFSESGHLALVSDFERNKRWRRTFLLDPDKPGAEGKVIWSRNVQDRYHDPGTPVMKMSAGGQPVIAQQGSSVLLAGLGASPKGDYPFLDKLDIETGKSERIFQSAPGSYEVFEAALDDAGTKFLTLRETSKDPPNYYIRTTGAQAELKPFTKYPNTTPQLQGITKQLVKYKREDGVPLSFTLYLPPGYKQGTRLPTVVWAYPLEYNDADTAGQIAGSTDRFTTITGYSELFFLLRGYAVLENAAMPVVGDAETVNNTYLEQIVADAKAAIDKAVEMGVTDL